MHLSLSELPYKPCLDCSKQKLSSFGSLPRSRHIVKEPLELSCRKISIYHKPCLFSEGIGKPLFLQRIRILCRASALPYYRVINRLSCIFIPYNCGLSLVSNAYRTYVGCRSLNIGHSLLCHLKLCGPDFLCIMLHPARLWKKLRKFLLCHTAHLALLIEKYTPVAGRARI